PTQIHTLSLHDALPIYGTRRPRRLLVVSQEAHEKDRNQTAQPRADRPHAGRGRRRGARLDFLFHHWPYAREHSHVVSRGHGLGADRKSTRLNSSHVAIS